MMKGCAAVGGFVVMPSELVRAGNLPPLTPLKSLPDNILPFIQPGLRRWLPVVDDIAWPIQQRSVYQQICARRLLWLAWPKADALTEFEQIGARWPFLQPVIGRMVEARIDERENWDDDGYWDFSMIRS